MTEKFIAIIQTGTAIKSALNKFGDFNQWFINGMDIDKDLTKTYRIYDNLEFPNPKDLAGVIITGSSAMVTDSHNWNQATQEWLKQFIDSDIPILAVCYGHQLLATLLAGTVDWNPNGREIGQVNMQVTMHIHHDKLFTGIVEPQATAVKFLASHQQSVLKLPDNVTLLGATTIDQNHCFRYKDHVWGLQFHPEFTSEIIKEYICARANDIIEDGLSPNQLLKEIEENDNGFLLLQNFRDICFST